MFQTFCKNVKLELLQEVQQEDDNNKDKMETDDKQSDSHLDEVSF